MNHLVFWSPEAEPWLEEILRNTGAAVRYVEAVKEIDRQLVADPASFGESRYANVRIAFVAPLGVQFEVLGDVRIVIVFDVWPTDWK